MNIDLVVKVGGSLLAFGEHFDAVMAAIAAAAPSRRLLVVPGGGPFADAVRDVDRRLGLPDDTAHWMAVLAMDQYAHLVASRLAGGVVVADVNDMSAALNSGGVPILAPSRWMRQTDPLPHSWDVTSDSIAAWVAGQVGARHLVLVKPPGAPDTGLVDRYFVHALAAHVAVIVVRADQRGGLDAALREGAAT